MPESIFPLLVFDFGMSGASIFYIGIPVKPTYLTLSFLFTGIKLVEFVYVLKIESD